MVLGHLFFFILIWQSALKITLSEKKKLKSYDHSNPKNSTKINETFNNNFEKNNLFFYFCKKLILIKMRNLIIFSKKQKFFHLFFNFFQKFILILMNSKVLFKNYFLIYIFRNHQ